MGGPLGRVLKATPAPDTGDAPLPEALGARQAPPQPPGGVPGSGGPATAGPAGGEKGAGRRFPARVGAPWAVSAAVSANGPSASRLSAQPWPQLPVRWETVTGAPDALTEPPRRCGGSPGLRVPGAPRRSVPGGTNATKPETPVKQPRDAGEPQGTGGPAGGPSDPGGQARGGSRTPSVPTPLTLSLPSVQGPEGATGPKGNQVSLGGGQVWGGPALTTPGVGLSPPSSSSSSSSSVLDPHLLPAPSRRRVGRTLGRTGAGRAPPAGLGQRQGRQVWDLPASPGGPGPFHMAGDLGPPEPSGRQLTPAGVWERCGPSL